LLIFFLIFLFFFYCIVARKSYCADHQNGAAGTDETALQPLLEAIEKSNKKNINNMMKNI
jgi:hypothetical protein